MAKIFTIDGIDDSNIATVGILGIDHNFFRDQRALFSSLLHFDQIHILDIYSLDDPDARKDLETVFEMSHEEFERTYVNLIALEEMGLIRRGKWSPFDFGQEVWQDGRSGRFRQVSDIMMEKANAILEDPGNRPFSEHKDQVDVYFNIYSMCIDANVRIGTSMSNKNSKHNFVSILNNDFGPEYMNIQDSPHTTILRIAVNKLPVIDSLPNLSKIKAFKEDPDTRLKLSRLRNWVIEISKKEYSAEEIEQKMDYLLMEYTNQFSIHEIKHRTSVAKSIIMPIPEIAESLDKLQFSKLGKNLFDIQKTSMVLLEDEVKFPGSEIAFLHKAGRTDFS